MTRVEARRAEKLQKLGACGPFVAASLNKVTRRCGNPNCKCAKGQPHQAHTLTFKVNAKTKTVHVPKDLVSEVTQWVREHKRVRKLMREISKDSLEIIRGYVRTQRRRAKTQKSSQQ